MSDLKNICVICSSLEHGSRFINTATSKNLDPTKEMLKFYERDNVKKEVYARAVLYDGPKGPKEAKKMTVEFFLNFFDLDVLDNENEATIHGIVILIDFTKLQMERAPAETIMKSLKDKKFTGPIIYAYYFEKLKEFPWSKYDLNANQETQVMEPSIMNDVSS